MLRVGGKIPIVVHPFFWLLVFVIGLVNAYDMASGIIWMVVIVASVLVHEFGHALMGLSFGQKVRIELVGFGGVTIREGSKLKLWKEFLVVLSGPVAGILLCLVSFVALNLVPERLWAVRLALQVAVYVNAFWSVFNLIPIMPLDGGHLLRIVLEGFLGVKGTKVALFLGVVMAVLLALFLFTQGALLIGGLFMLLAFESYRSWRAAYHMTTHDKDDGIQEMFRQAEQELSLGHYTDALEKFRVVREKSGRGMFYGLATVQMARVMTRLGETREALNLLKPEEKKLPKEAFPLLHNLAFEEGDFDLVSRLANDSYTMNPSVEIAWRNSIAYGYRSDVRAVVGWLRCAMRDGMVVTLDTLDNVAFRSVRHNKEFLDLESSIKERV